MRSDAPFEMIDGIEIRKTALIRRQARVGILANPARVSVPAHAPRDVWTRWPRLRSARRQRGLDGVEGRRAQQTDPVLNGASLKDFAEEMRHSEPLVQEEPDLQITIAHIDSVAPPFDAGRVAVRLGLGVLLAGLALVGIPLALR